MLELAVGIVLYQPNIDRLNENIQAIYKQAKEILLVDNGSSNLNLIRKLVSSYERIIVIENETNRGIAYALNQIMTYFIKENYEWVLTLDQDSICPSCLFDEYGKFMNLPSAGMLCPVVNDRNFGYLNKIFKKPFTEVEGCITSASFVNAKAWLDIAGFDETMFIDSVDFDFSYRVIQSGYKIYQINSVVLLHEIGHIEIKRFLIWKIIIKNHSAFRKYYIARNTIYLARKKKNIYLILKSFAQNIKLFIITMLYETDKKAKALAIFKGSKAGVSAAIRKESKE